MHVFNGNSASEVWAQALEKVKSPDAIKQPSRAGITREISGATLVISNPRQRWVVAREPAMSIAFSIAEVIGLINGRRDARYLNYFNPALPRFAGNGDEYHGAYGHRLRVNFGFDQIHQAFSALCANPESRQVVLQIWDPSIDFPDHQGIPKSNDIPCNVCSMLKIRQNRLYWTQVMRSNDLFRGLPYNFVQFTTLQEVMAGWLGCDLGTYTHISDSLHLYEDSLDISHNREAVEEPENTDSLVFPKDEADCYWRELNMRIDRFTESGLKEVELRKLALMEGFPAAIRNLAVIVGADAARRRGYEATASELAESCTNSLLRLLWLRWNSRANLPTKVSAGSNAR